MIKCKICNKKFKDKISWQHLKTEHGLTTLQYKKVYGEVSTESFKKSRSENSKGEKNSNYGNKHSAETKEKIRKKRSQQIIYSSSIQKAMKTKIKRYGKIIGPMTGKKHSQDTITKLKSIANDRKIQSFEDRKIRVNNKLKDSKLQALEFNENYVSLSCNTCSNKFTLTYQCFNNTNWKDTYCSNCFPNTYTQSKDEIEILDILRDKFPNETILSGNRSEIFPLEIDIYFPNLKIGIEYCGLYWHSDNFKETKYHQKKYLLAKEKGIQLITIFEDEWKNKKDLVLEMIFNRLNSCNKRIYARNCTVRKITTSEAKPFLNKNHIQGLGKSQIKYGVFYQTELVSVMTFSKNEISRKNKDMWEINRYASKSGCNILGAAGKLFKQFVTEYNPEHVLSYSDLRWGEGNVYEKIGFKLDKMTVPGYWYFMLPDVTRKHRFTLRKNSTGYSRIFDCGNNKWVWSRDKAE